MLIRQNSAAARMFAAMLFVTTLAVAQQANAADDDPFVRAAGGTGALIEKLIVVKDGAEVRESESFNTPLAKETPKPFSIFWRLKTGTPGDEKDGFFLAGDPDGKAVCWIKKDAVKPWRTRVALDPVVAVESASGTPATGIFTIYNDKKLSDPAMEFIGTKGRVPIGHKRFVTISDPGSEDAEPENEIYPVLLFTGGLEAASKSEAGVKAQIASDFQETELGVVFVVDATGSMEPLVEAAKSVIQQISSDVTKGNVKGKVKFGLVEYRDKGDEFVARVSSKLDANPTKLADALKNVVCTGGGDTAEAVTIGLELAIKDAGWDQNSARHIILLGDAPNNSTSEGPTIEDIIKASNQSGGSDQQKALRSVMIHTVASYRGTLDSVVEEEFKRLTQGERSGSEGFALKMDVGDEGAKKEVATAIIAGLRDQLKMLAEIGDTGDLKKTVATSETGKAMSLQFYRIRNVSGHSGDKEIYEGFARPTDEKGNRVATIKMLVMRDELRRLWAGLDLLLAQFKNLKKGRGDIKQIVDRLRAAIAGTATGDRLDVTESTTLEEIIGKDLPMKTNALRITIADVATMEAADFDDFIAKLESSRKRAAELGDDKELFSRVNELIESAEAAFLEYSDLP